MQKAPEVVEGLFREGNLVTVSGGFGVGKSPFINDLMFAVAHGADWCGRRTTPHPILVIDHESLEGMFLDNWERLAHRRKLAVPDVPRRAELYMEHGHITDAYTQQLLDAIAKPPAERLHWIGKKLAGKPNAVVVVDPLDMLFTIDKNKGPQVVWLYRQFRNFKRDFPQASFIFVFNVKKTDRRAAHQPNLLENPHDWLQETSGSLDLQNRADARLGLAYWETPDDELLVLNGVRRGEKMEPILLEPVWYQAPGSAQPERTGFQRVASEAVHFANTLSPRMREVWTSLGTTVTKEDLQAEVSRATAYRLLQRALSLGILVEVSDGVYQKVERI